jgi:hypothetical protein
MNEERELEMVAIVTDELSGARGLCRSRALMRFGGAHAKRIKSANERSGRLIELAMNGLGLGA